MAAADDDVKRKKSARIVENTDGKGKASEPEPHVVDPKNIGLGEDVTEPLNEDGEEMILDFVLVYRISKVSIRGAALITLFLRNLKDMGVHHETVEFSLSPDVIFLKLYGSTKKLYECAEAYFIELACQSSDFKPPVTRPYWKFTRNDLNDPAPDGMMYQRAPQYINVLKQSGMTRSERILLLYTILTKTRFGKGEYDVGIEKLISKGIFECGYPVHDGNHQWTETGPLNERQLLKKYWSSLRCTFKQQPLDIIHHYYGPQTSFFFAWLGFYNKMLIPASITGLLFFGMGLFVFGDRYKDTINDICYSDFVMCPKCITRNCRYEHLSHSCFTATYSYAFDNPMTFTFAVLMSIWAAVLMRMWKREETILMMKWDLRSLEIDNSMRDGFIEKATHRKISQVTGEITPTVPKMTKCVYYLFTSSIMVILVIVNVCIAFVIMLLSYRLSIVIIKYSTITSLTRHASIISSLLGMVASAIFVKIYSLGYHRITWWLTNIENPRTQIDFDNSYIYKIYILAFVNNYSTVFYNAFFKGNFFTYPGDRKRYVDYFGIATDICDPSGCILNLGMYMVISLVFKETLWDNLKNLCQIIRSKIREDTNIKAMSSDSELLTDQWERDFMLDPIKKLKILEEYLDLAIQYGFVTFFVACFPLAPALALLVNLFELRLDASRRVLSYRRTIPYKVMGMGAWNGIFQAATLIGVITNALIIAFTSDFISKEMYRSRIQSLKGYVEFSLSIFNSSDYVNVDFDWAAEPICHYIGKRYGPAHPHKYELTNHNMKVFSTQLKFIVIFEHVLILMTGLVVRCVSTMPYRIEQLISNQEQHYKELRIGLIEDGSKTDQRTGRTRQRTSATSGSKSLASMSSPTGAV